MAAKTIYWVASVPVVIFVVVLVLFIVFMDICIGCAKNCNLSLNITLKNISVTLWCYIQVFWL